MNDTIVERWRILPLFAGICVMLQVGCTDEVAAPTEKSAFTRPPPASSSSNPEVIETPAPGVAPPAAGARSAKHPFIGQWFSCDRRLRFAADGSWKEEDLIVGCAFEGTWSYDGVDLKRELKKTDCTFEGNHSLKKRALGPMESVMPAVEESPDRLFLIFRETITTRLYFGPDIGRETWRFEGATEGEPDRKRVMLSRVVGDPQAFFIGSFWSPDRNCSAFFGCGGRINNWHLDDKRLSVSASSQGECASAGTLDGEVQGDGTVQGTYTSIRCGRVEKGTFVGRRVKLE